MKKLFNKHFSVLFAFLLLESNSIYSQPSFSPWVNIPTTNQSKLLSVGDLNNDGLLDIATVTDNYPNFSDPYRLVVFLQNPLGGLALSYSIDLPNSYPALNSLSLADVNNDNRDDVIIGFGDSIGVFIQNNTGTLNAMIKYYSGGGVDAIKTGDLNNDGLIDIAVSHSHEFYIRVFYQSVNGFTTTTYPVLLDLENEIDIGDVNSDGLNDVVIKPGLYYGGVRVFFQDTIGLLQNPYTLYSPTPLLYYPLDDLEIFDFNNDGLNDIVASGGGNSPNATLVIWPQDTILFQAPLKIPVYEVPKAIKVSDLDNDGKKEIILTHAGWTKLSLFTQDSLGSYGTYNLIPAPYINHFDPEGTSIGDVNNDGWNDIVVAGESYGIVIFYNNTFAASVSNQFTQSNNISIYPNPTNDVVHVSVLNQDKIFEVKILDLKGSLVFCCSNKGQSQLLINMKDFPQGTYFISVKTSEWTQVKKIVLL